MSPRYIEIAKERAKSQRIEDRVRFKVADMRRIASVLSDEKPFDGVINLFTSFGFYDDKTNADILRQCCNLVRANGFFVLEIMNRDWIIRNFQERSFSRYEGLIVLEDRDFDVKTSRMHAIWTCLLQQDDKNFVLKKQITIDHRIWSLHELIEMFGKTGWEFKAVYPGFGKKRDDVPIMEAKCLLFIAKKL